MIYLIRHGLDDETFIGGYSNVGLTDIGKKQIEESVLFIKENNLNINKIYSSDIKRAIESANIISNILNININLNKELREQDKGLLNGIKKDIAKEKYPNYINVNSIYTKYPNGESLLDLYKRIKIFLESVNKYDNSLLVTHRGVINMIYYLLNNDQLNMNKEKYNVEHASIHELNINKIRRIK